jgi:hypothetical protein
MIDGLIILILIMIYDYIYLHIISIYVYVCLFTLFIIDNGTPFISLTIHWINNNWELKSLPLECVKFPGSHTAVDIVSKVDQLLANTLLNSLLSCQTILSFIIQFVYGL